MNRIIIIAIFSVSIVTSLIFLISSNNKLKDNLIRVNTENEELSIKIKSNQLIHDNNITIMNKIVSDSKKATSEAMENTKKAESNFNKSKRELNEATISYNNLVNDGLRLRDPFAIETSNSDEIYGAGQNDIENIACSSSRSGDNTPIKDGLSEGLTRYLINQMIKADDIVNQLSIVQEYTKEQHQWILNNCNAE